MISGENKVFDVEATWFLVDFLKIKLADNKIIVYSPMEHSKIIDIYIYIYIYIYSLYKLINIIYGIRGSVSIIVMFGSWKHSPLAPRPTHHHHHPIEGVYQTSVGITPPHVGMGSTMRAILCVFRRDHPE
jgi:hypothetical protein